MYCKKVPSDSQRLFYKIWDDKSKMAHTAFSMQNCIHFFRWTAVLTVVTNAFLTTTICEEYCKALQFYSFHIVWTKTIFYSIFGERLFFKLGIIRLEKQVCVKNLNPEHTNPENSQVKRWQE